LLLEPLGPFDETAKRQCDAYLHETTVLSSKNVAIGSRSDLGRKVQALGLQAWRDVEKRLMLGRCRTRSVMASPDIEQSLAMGYDSRQTSQVQVVSEVILVFRDKTFR
jgi:hypothetical protein